MDANRDESEQAPRDGETARRMRDADTFKAALAGMLGSSLECASIAREFASVCTLHMAEYAVVTLNAHDARAPATVFAHAGTARDMQPAALAAVARGRLEYAVSSGQTHLYTADNATGDAPKVLCAELPRRSCIAVPVMVRGSAAGAVLVARRQRYDSHDATLLEYAVQRLAAVIDNAWQYAAATRTLRAHDEMLNFVAHDLRNPLNVIMMAADLLRDRTPPRDDFTAHWLRAILQSAERMNILIEDLLTNARAESGALLTQRRRVPARVLLHEAFAAHEDAAAGKGIHTEVSVPEENLHVDVDENSVVRALSNLIGNAVRHTPAGGEIRLSARTRGDVVEFCVQDNGSGIAPEHVSHIFDRFWQAPGARSAGGAGLGLAIVKSIIEAHGGEVRVDSSPGAGSSFYFTVPVQVAPHARAVAIAR